MSEQNDNRHNSVSWTMITGITILVYVLSAVPIEWLAKRGILRDSMLAAIRGFYWPLKWLLDWYLDLWKP